MGLGYIELLMEIEDEFGLHIPDEEAEFLATVGQTVDYLVGRLRERAGAGGAQCATAHAFYALRRELLNRVGGHRRHIRPESRLGDVLPKRERHHWPAIAEHVGLRPERYRAPNSEYTLADVIRTRALPTFLGPDGQIDEPAVFEKVCRIAAEQSDMDPRELHRETDFIRDLNMD